MTLELKIPRRLESPNTWNGKHWRTKYRITQTWEQEIHLQTLPQIGPVYSRDVPDARMRVDVERHVPSRRHFIRDEDNLVFATKPLRDALKRQYLIRDDSSRWLLHPIPTQYVSEDGKDWTVIRIRPASM